MQVKIKFPQFTQKPSIILAVYFRPSRQSQQAASDLHISIRSQMFNFLLPQKTVWYKMIFSNGQQSQDLLGVPVTLKISHHRLQLSRTRHTLFPFSVCIGIIALWCSHISSHHLLSMIPSRSCLWATVRLVTEKYSSSVSRSRLPTSSALPTQPLPLD